MANSNFSNCYRFGLTPSFYRQACADDKGRLYELVGFSDTLLRLSPLSFIGDEKYVSLGEFSDMMARAYKQENDLVSDAAFRDMTGALSLASRENPSQFNWYRHGALASGKLFELVSIIDDDTFVLSPMDEKDDAFITVSGATAREMLIDFCLDDNFSVSDRADIDGIAQFFDSIDAGKNDLDLCFNFA